MSGPTGLLGEYLLKDLITMGWNVAVLCRSAPGRRPEDRIENLMVRWEQQLGRALPRPVVIDSDITENDLGISISDRAWIKRHCYAFLHNAASLTFDTNREDGEPWRSNLIGTQHAIRACKEAGIAFVFHVSTAYVCGRRTGAILESELDIGQSFATEYEASKCASEIEWRNASFDHLTVFRPAIIVGDSESGYTSTYHGFYAPLKSMATLLLQGAKLGVSDEPVPMESMLAALGLTGSEEKNFVPVEWVSRVIASVVSVPASWGRVYHLTPEERVSAHMAAAAMQRSLVKYFRSTESHEKSNRQTENVQPQFNGPSDGELQGSERPKNDWSSLGKAFSNQVSAYQEYWRDDPVFDTRNLMDFAQSTKSLTPDALKCPRLDDVVLERLCDFAIRSGFGWPKPRFDPLSDSIVEWLLERAVESKLVSKAFVQLNAIGSGGGSIILGDDEAGNIVFEKGFSGELPRVTFGLRYLKEKNSFSALEACGQAWVQLTSQEKTSPQTLEEHIDFLLRRLDSVAQGSHLTSNIVLT